MKIGYNGFWIEINMKEAFTSLASLIKKQFKKEINKKQLSKVCQYRIGLIKEETGLLYQTGEVQVSMEQVYEIVKNFDFEIFAQFNFRVYPLIQDLFQSHQIVSCGREYGGEEGQDNQTIDFCIKF